MSKLKNTASPGFAALEKKKEPATFEEVKRRRKTCAGSPKTCDEQYKLRGIRSKFD